MTRHDVYEKVFTKVIDAMEQGTAPWIRPWTGASHMPYNALTGRQYSGGNVIALWGAGVTYSCNGWMTFKQAVEAGCVVRKGEHGVPVYFMSQATKGKKDDDEEAISRYFFAKGFVVFNVEQLDDLEPGAVAKLRARHEEAPVRSEYERLEGAERVISDTGATIQHGGSRACYNPFSDVIRMPDRESFITRHGYYETVFHELAHWTGHEKRLNRTTPTKFGNPDYAFEELVAELGAAFVCARLGIENVGQSAAYLKGWAQACRDMPDLLPRAASLATKAADHLTGDQSPITEPIAA